jgi:hypothetical protein
MSRSHSLKIRFVVSTLGDAHTKAGGSKSQVDGTTSPPDQDAVIAPQGIDTASPGCAAATR